MSEPAGKRVRRLTLIVDDDIEMRAVLANSLRDSGLDVVEAGDGAEGVDLFRKLAPDLVILAEILPQLDGYQTCAALRDLPNGWRSPVLMLMDNEDEDSLRRAFDAGVTDFVRKPIDPTALGRHLPFMLRSNGQADGATDLPSRALFIERLRGCVSHAERSGRKVATVILDLRNLRQVNDSLGDEVGDALLADLERRIRHIVRVHDEMSRAVDSGVSSSVARWGGDELLLAIANLSSGEHASGIASRILETLKAPVQHQGHDFHLSGSMGISLFPDNSKDPVELLHYAALALNQAKGARGNTFAFFSPPMNAQAKARFGLEDSLRRAIGTDEITFHYQPIVDAREGRIVGAEALSRWYHPRVGYVSPDQFVPIAEQLGLIGELNRHLMERACEQVRSWQQQGLPPLYVSVNISGKQFRDRTLARSLTSAVKRQGLNPDAFLFEVTEGALIDSLAECERTLAELKERGFRIAIDDFGTGYSSLNYLMRFPLDVLKIDRAFIRDIAASEARLRLATGVVFLAQGLGLQTVAEGVETVEQRDLLLACGCELMQGYLFAKPMPAGDLTSLLEETRGCLAEGTLLAKGHLDERGADDHGAKASDPVSATALRVLDLKRRQSLRPTTGYRLPRTDTHNVK